MTKNTEFLLDGMACTEAWCLDSNASRCGTFPCWSMVGKAIICFDCCETVSRTWHQQPGMADKGSWVTTVICPAGTTTLDLCNLHRKVCLSHRTQSSIHSKGGTVHLVCTGHAHYMTLINVSLRLVCRMGVLPINLVTTLPGLAFVLCLLCSPASQPLCMYTFLTLHLVPTRCCRCSPTACCGWESTCPRQMRRPPARCSRWWTWRGATCQQGQPSNRRWTGCMHTPCTVRAWCPAGSEGHGERTPKLPP